MSPVKPNDFLVLLVLSGGDLHGYGIKKEVLARTGGAVDLEAGTLYRLLARLLDAGLLQESECPSGESDDERRKYYRLTPAGREQVVAEAKRLAALVGSADVQALLGRQV